jgi:hypothetical protein
LHAAALNGKRLLALWNALPGVEKRRKVGDRGALIDQLWSAIEALPEPASDAKRPSKQDAVTHRSRVHSSRMSTKYWAASVLTSELSLNKLAHVPGAITPNNPDASSDKARDLRRDPIA